MSSEAAWKESVKEVPEKPLPGTQATYPLLGDERSDEPSTGERNWSVRLVLREEYSGEALQALSEDTQEVFTETPEVGEELPSVLRAEKAGAAARVWPDLNLLRNVAEIQRLKATNPQIDEWILVCPGEAGDDPEVLVGETIRQLTGVLAGFDVLEIRQGEGESFTSLWGRLNVARLMATEAELQSCSDPTSGAGLFAILRERLEK